MARYAKHTFRSGKYSNGIVKRRGVGRYIFLLFLIVALVCGGLFIFKILDNNNYSDEESFIKYSERNLAKMNDERDFGEEQIKFNYGKPASVAMSYPKIDNEFIDKKVKDIVELRKLSFIGEHKDDKKDEKSALLISHDTYDGASDTGSIVIKSLEKIENDNGKLENKSSKVDAVVFNKKNNTRLYPIMIFEAGYAEKLSKYFDSYLQKEYKSFLTEDYKEYISPEKNRFENFALDGESAIFYFNSDTVVRGSEEISIKVDKNTVQGLFRSQINERKLDPSKPMVALTYDDGPDSSVTEKIVDALKKNNAVATFFLVGENVDSVKGAKKLIEKMIKNGNEIGSHTYTQPNLLSLSDSMKKEENEKTDKAIIKAAGYKPSIYRPPYGFVDDNTNKIFGKSAILWSIDTGDWLDNGKESIVNTVKSEENLDGKVILMHSIYDSSASASEELIPWLTAKGYQLVTVSELLMYKYNEDPHSIKTYGYNFFDLENVKGQ